MQSGRIGDKFLRLSGLTKVILRSSISEGILIRCQVNKMNNLITTGTNIFSKPFLQKLFPLVRYKSRGKKGPGQKIPNLPFKLDFSRIESVHYLMRTPCYCCKYFIHAGQLPKQQYMVKYCKLLMSIKIV